MDLQYNFTHIIYRWGGGADPNYFGKLAAGKRRKHCFGR